MTAYYIDTSALAKYYIPEIGIPWIQGLIHPSTGNIVVISDATALEMFSLLERRRKAGSLTPPMIAAVQSSFLQHANQHYLVEPVDTLVFIQARGLVIRHNLRTLDALQLASALNAMRTLGSQLIFISADIDLLTAAQTEGFIVDNPNSYS